MKQFNVQLLFEQQPSISMEEQCMGVLRDTWIRPLHDKDQTIYTLQNERQRKVIAFILANLSRKYWWGGTMDGIIDNKKMRATLDRFYLTPYIQSGYFMLAGGFLSRMIDNPDQDVGAIAEQHDLDIFYKDTKHVYNWIRTLVLAGVHVELENQGGRHDLFRVTPPKESVLSRTPRSWLIQFSITDCKDVFDLMEIFDLPNCQLAVDRRLQCVSSLAFLVMQRYKGDVAVHVSNAQTEKKKEYFQECRLQKYSERGHVFKVVEPLLYFGQSSFNYASHISHTLFAIAGNIDTSLAFTFFKKTEEPSEKRQKFDEHAVSMNQMGVYDFVVNLNPGNDDLWEMAHRGQ